MPTTVGPVTVTDSGCGVQTLGQNTCVVSCAAQIVNTSGKPVVLSYQQASSDGTPITEGSIEVQTLQANGKVNLPAPASGQSWLVVAISENRAQHLAEDVNVAGWVIFGLAIYGGYRLYQDHKHRLPSLLRGY